MSSFLFFFVPTSVGAATKYVDLNSPGPTHDGSSWDNAWLTLAAAESGLSDGDTVRVKSGTYTENNMAFNKAITWVADDGTGSAGAVTVLNSNTSFVASVAGAKDMSWSNFTFDAQNSHAYPVYIYAGSGAKSFINCTFSNSNGAYNLSVNGSHNITLTNPTFSGTGARMFYSSNTVAVTITNPVFAPTTASNILLENTAAATTNIVGGSAALTGSQGLLAGAGSFNISGGFHLTYTSANNNSAAITNVTANLDIQDSTFDLDAKRQLILNYNTTLGNLIFKGNNVNGAPTYAGSMISMNKPSASSIIDVENNIFTLSVGSSDGINALSINPSTPTSSGDITFKGNTINNSIATTAAYGSSVYVGNIIGNVYVQNNIINNTGLQGQGIVILNTTNSDIRGNYIYNTKLAFVGINVTSTTTAVSYIGHNSIVTHQTSGLAIQLGYEPPGSNNDQTMNGSIMEYNYVLGPLFLGDAAAGTTHALFVGSQKAAVRYNIVYGLGYGLVLKDFNTDMNYEYGAYGNIFINCNALFGLLLKGINNENVYNNLIYESQSAASGLSGLGFGYNPISEVNYYAIGNHVYNNIIVSNAQNNLVNSSSNIAGSSFLNNVYWNWANNSATQVFNYENSSVTGLSNWRSQTNVNNDTSAFANPLFKDNTFSDVTYSGDGSDLTYASVQTYANKILADVALNYNSPAIDAGYSNGQTTDVFGNPIYGTHDVGVYEYQPPYTITSDRPQYSGNIRIYGDGKYRYTTATTTTTAADLSVVPAEGSFAAHQTFGATDTRPEWLNISNISWGTSKQFTASSSIATTTIYTVGDLTPGAYYVVSYKHADNATTTLINLQANESGRINFTYAEGYSTVVFDVSPDTVAPTTGEISFYDVTGTSITASSTGATDNVALAALPYLYHNITSDTYFGPTTLPWTITGLTSNTTYVFEVGVQDISGNWATSTTYSIKTPVLPNNQPPQFVVKKIPQITNSPLPIIFNTNLSVGNTSDDVKNLQVYLNTHGYTVAVTGAGSPGLETALFGPATKAALIKFQKANNIIPATGDFGPRTRALINGATNVVTVSEAPLTPKSTPVVSSFDRDLEKGMTGEDVRALQVYLNTHGYVVATTGAGSVGHETTLFGSATKAALVKFQKASGISPASGYFGPKTRAYMLSN